MVDLRVNLGPLVLANPVLVAAGTFAYGIEFAKAARLDRLGGVVTKTLTLLPREGNPPPRIVETPSGMLNSIGIQNIGLDAFLKGKLPLLLGSGVTVIVSILGESAGEISDMVQALDRAEGVSAIELNLSCPNLNPKAESETPPSPAPLPPLIAQDPSATSAMVRAAREHTKKCIIAKLSPEVTDLAPIAKAAEGAGADALSVVNTFRGMAIDPETRRPRLDALTGGLSGPAIRPLAIYRVWYTAQTVRIPIIGLGGIVRAADAAEFILAGASAIAIGTANFANPRAALEALRDLERYLNRQKLSSIRELVGSLDLR